MYNSFHWQKQTNELIMNSIYLQSAINITDAFSVYPLISGHIWIKLLIQQGSTVIIHQIIFFNYNFQ